MTSFYKCPNCGYSEIIGLEIKFGTSIRKCPKCGSNLEHIVSSWEESISEFKYDFALSFAGEDRQIVEELAKNLEEKDIIVFYDQFRKAELWGKDLSQFFKKTYGRESKYVVIFISKHYEVKEWTNFEFEIARDEAKKRKEEFILPIRLDDTILYGLKPTRAILDYRAEGAEDMGSWITKRV